jgi:hypothetical protein
MSIKEIFELIKVYLNIVWSKKIWIVICALLFSVFLGVRAKLQPDIYKAKLSFIVNEDDSRMPGIGSIVGGLGLGGNSGGKNYEKIMGIARSNKLLEQVLMEKTTINGSTDWIGNHIIKLYNYHESWEEHYLLSDFLYSPTNLSSKAAIVSTKKLVSLLRGYPSDSYSNSMLSINYNSESTFLTILGKTEYPDLSVKLAKIWYDKILTFYVQNSTEKQQKTLDRLTAKSDSIYTLLVGSETQLAKGTDKMGLIKAIDNLPISQQSRNLKIYVGMYAEVIKNKETTSFLLENKMPYFQTIDTPILPINKMNKWGWFIWSIVGFIAGGLLGVVLVAGRHYIIQELNA